METILQSRSKTVIIGPDRPFVVIGERINPSGRKKLAAEMMEGNFERVISDAVAQVEAGAHMLDVNAGIPLADEPALLARVVREVQAVVDVPLSIDSSKPEALEAALAAYEGKALVNSVTGEEEKMEAVLPLIKKYGAAVIALTYDENGIPHDPETRLAIARKIIERAADYGIPPEDVIVDTLVMPAGAVQGSGAVTVETTRLVRQELGHNTVCGASNVSFGLPARDVINAHFISMLIGAGMTSGIVNPLKEGVRQAILAADMLMGHDENCLRWIRAMQPAGVASDRAERRGRRRRRRERE
jgi:5-methyltetrahydrofolate--homocysteine methyltransferase